MKKEETTPATTEVKQVIRNVIKDGEDEFIQIINDVNDFQFAKLEKEGDKIKGILLGSYLSVCSKMNSKPNNKLKNGTVLLTDTGLKIISNFHSLDEQLNKIAEGSYILITRGESVYRSGKIQEGKPDFVRFHVGVKR